MAARVVIVGGGFSGAAAAVQLVRRAARAVAVTIVEPRAGLGRGLAYATSDPDHRLNATAERHALDPEEPLAFTDWIVEQRLDHHDPEARLPDGRCFARRQDFGRFVADAVAAHAAMPGGSTIGHLRDHASTIVPEGRGWRVSTVGGQHLAADLVIVATGNPPPQLPGFVSARAAARRGVIGNPMDGERIRTEVAATDRVCVLGSGLTALDVLSSLLRGGHRGPITVVSRRGLRPRPQPDTDHLPGLLSGRRPFDAPGGPLPDFIASLGPQPRLRAIVHALREQVRLDGAAGRPWYAAFGALRDAVWRFWPALSEADKRRFVRHLKVWYDVHRFLSPPQNEAMVREAQATGAVRFRAARVSAVDAAADDGTLQVRWLERGATVEGVEPFDALINCTGIDGTGAGTRNPFLQAALAQGWLQPGPAGLGFAVDDTLRAIGRDGVVRDTLRVIGPPSVGARGDPIGAGFIALQLWRVMPDLLATLWGRAPGS